MSNYVDDDYDVVVLGSGASGLTAALSAADAGARVVVIEKNDRVGGSSAWSGGHIWIPNHHRMPEIGASDSRTGAMAYLMSLSRGLLDEVHILRSAGDRGVEQGRQHHPE